MANGESRTGRQCGVGRQRGNDKEPTYRAQIGYPASFHGLVVIVEGWMNGRKYVPTLIPTSMPVLEPDPAL